MKINPKNSAFLLIEFQKTWTERGFFKSLINKNLNSRNVISKSLDILKSGRSHNYPVIHAPFIINKEDKEIYKKLPLLPVLMKGFTHDTWKADFVDGVYKQGDTIIQGRYDFDATIGTDLVLSLKNKNIQNVFIMGFTTDQCIYKTLKSLEKESINCFIISDCTATIFDFMQRRIENNTTVLSVNDLKILL